MNSTAMDSPIAFTKGFAYRKDLLYVVAVDRQLEEANVPHAIILRYLDEKWGHWQVENRIVAICVFRGPEERTVVAMGIDGRVQITDKTGQRWEKVGEGDDAPSELRHLSVLRVIGDSLYVAGMARQVYRSHLDGRIWDRADNGVLVPHTSQEIAGFNGIDGFDESDIYAVGLYGQIWRRLNGEWRQIESPTNLKLHCIRSVKPDLAFACGASGTVIAGHGTAWRVINNDATDLAFWGMEYFKGILYLSTDQGSIYKVQNDRIMRVNLPFDGDVSTNWLHCNQDVLLSIGNRDLVLFDGQTWSRLTHPQ